jgi:hypothetical protein
LAFKSYLVFAPPPACIAGVGFDPAVTIAAQDAAGNIDVAFTAAVTVAIGTNPGGSTLHGTVTVAPTAGVAVFTDLFLDKAARGNTLTATTTAPGYPAATSAPFTVVPGSPAALAFAVQPSNSGAGIEPMIQVAMFDAEGNLTTSMGAQVTLALGNNPTGATLGGAITARSLDGKVTFSGLTVSAPGAGYTLVATDPLGVMTPATSQPFDVRAPVNVGDGTAASCTEAALTAALAAGGHVHFACGPLPVTITLTSTKTIGVNVGLDGGGLVTLSGGGTVQLFSIPSATVTLALENLAITNGRVNGNGGAVTSAGIVSLSHCSVTGSVATIGDWAGGIGANGGAIYNNGGTLVVTGSTFSGNAAQSAWFTGTAASNGGAICSVIGTLLVADSTFSGNTTFSNWSSYATTGNGGAIYADRGALQISGSTFTSNQASSEDCVDKTCSNGGAIYSAGGRVLVARSSFGGNVAKASFANGSTVGNGGAIFNDGGRFVVANSTFGANAARTDYPYPSISGNGGAVRNVGGDLSIINSTLAGNGAYSTHNYTSNVSGLGGALYGEATLSNTIVASSPAGGNCSGAFVDGGRNLDSDASCGVGPATNPLLAAAGLANNGGTTLTIALQATSPAIDAGDGAVCAAAPVSGVDQRGYQRPGTGATTCSIGAFEYGSPGPP